MSINPIPENICNLIHKLAWELPRYQFPLEAPPLPRNGVYLLFERGERGHGGERIVRVGTHTGEGNLPGRLKEHFVNENKDRSIFRKNIGRAMLNACGDKKRLAQWNQRRKGALPADVLAALEQKVSAYLRQHFTFAVLPVEGLAERLAMEAGLIATIAQCDQCKPSKNWLGNQSPVAKIPQYGLWLVQHLKGTPFDYWPR